MLVKILKWSVDLSRGRGTVSRRPGEDKLSNIPVRVLGERPATSRGSSLAHRGRRTRDATRLRVAAFADAGCAGEICYADAACSRVNFARVPGCGSARSSSGFSTALARVPGLSARGPALPGGPCVWRLLCRGTAAVRERLSGAGSATRAGLRCSPSRLGTGEALGSGAATAARGATSSIDEGESSEADGVSSASVRVAVGA
jgi:hypothetical protein